MSVHVNEKTVVLLASISTSPRSLVFGPFLSHLTWPSLSSSLPTIFPLSPLLMSLSAAGCKQTKTNKFGGFMCGLITEPREQNYSGSISGTRCG